MRSTIIIVTETEVDAGIQDAIEDKIHDAIKQILEDFQDDLGEGSIYFGDAS